MIKIGYSNKFTYIMGVGILWSAYSLVVAPAPLPDTLLLIGVMFFLTDLISGLLHVILDNPRSLDIDAIRGLAEGFQRHHEDPTNIYRMPLYEHLYVMHLPLTLMFFILLPFHEPRMYVVFLTAVVSLHVMQMAHLWAHAPAARVPKVVRRLQKFKLLLGKAQHGRHHRPPYNKNFCILTGMCNPLLNSAVAVIGHTTHWWNAVFLVVAVAPLMLAFLLSTS